MSDDLKKKKKKVTGAGKYQQLHLVAKSVLKTRQKRQMRENKSPISRQKCRMRENKSPISRQIATDRLSAPNALPKSPSLANLYSKRSLKTYKRVFALLMSNRHAHAEPRGTTPSSSDSCFEHGNNIWLLRLCLFLSFCGDIKNENIVKSAIKYNIVHVFEHAALKLNVQSSKYTDIYNDSKEIVSQKLISSANSLQRRY